MVASANIMLESLVSRMAPRLAQSKHSLISDMLGSKSYKAHEIAELQAAAPVLFMR
jgi:hypothetical protein